MKNVVRLAFIICTVFVVACSTVYHHASIKGTKIVILALEQADAELRKYAADGWRCVGVTTGTPISPMDLKRGYMLERTND
jgi:hypothetical protein